MSGKTIPAGDLEAELEHALQRGQVSVHYQPIVDLATGGIVSVEALVRWVHPKWGAVAPSDFIPTAERSGLIVPIDRWVLSQACTQVKAWQLRFPQRRPLVANVNLSAKLIHQTPLVDDVRRALRASGLDAACLRLEITESVLMQDSVANIRTLHALRCTGVGIAIDDFGTGYSSLSYLRWLPANVLKLDRSFTARLGTDPRDAVIVSGLLAIAKGLGMTVTAEGVETEQQQALLKHLGCDRGQGYHFARPLPPEDVTVLLQREVLGGMAAESADGPDSSSGARVLVIDDDDHIRKLTSFALELEGYEVVAAADGKAALEVLGWHSPNVILLDMMMPVMDGWSFARAYHALPVPHAPIIVLTAAADAAKCAATVGTADYLGKPFDVDDLLMSVDRLVQTSTN